MARVGFCMASYGPPKQQTIMTLFDMARNFTVWGTQNSHEMISCWSWNNLICGARKKLAEVAIKGGCDYILYLDADMVFPPFAAIRLLRNAEENDRKIVSGFYCGRKPPYTPLLLSDQGEDNNGGRFAAVMPDSYKGIYDCDATGMGCCLIHKEVFEKVPQPWFVLHEGQTEDIYFFDKARKESFRVYVDTEVVLGHVMEERIIIPIDDDKIWKAEGIEYMYADDFHKKDGDSHIVRIKRQNAKS